MSSDAKLILYKEIRESNRCPLNYSLQPGLAELRTSLLLAAARLPNASGRYHGSLSSSKAGDPKIYRLEPTMPHPDAIGTAQKETDLIPKSNRMPER